MRLILIGLGMIASPVMMRVIKSNRQKRKINKLLMEAAKDRLEQKNVDNNDNQNSRII
jgi:hypothetical protein